MLGRCDLGRPTAAAGDFRAIFLLAPDRICDILYGLRWVGHMCSACSHNLIADDSGRAAPARYMPIWLGAALSGLLLLVLVLITPA